MRRAYRFRMRPTAGQHVRLQACLDGHRELYNAALQERRDAYERVVRRSAGYFGPSRPRSPVRYGTQSAQLQQIRALRPDMTRWSFSSEQATLRRLNKAFDGFFRRLKAGEEPGYPRFKAEHRFDSVEWPEDGDGCRWKPDTARVYLQGVGDVKVTAHRPVQGQVKTLQVRREGRRWMLVLSCDNVPVRPLEPTGHVVGVDVGIASFATTSDGDHIANPRLGRTSADNLAAAQQVLAGKKKGSNNRRRARATVAARHRKVANQRRDFHHKTARALVAGHDIIAVEDLKIPNMVRRAAPRPDPDTPGAFLANGAAAKTGLNRSISDAGWAAFVAILRAKAEEAGRTVVTVDPRHTSDRCGACGHTAKDNRVSQAVFRCQACGHQAHADHNAAANILRAGLALLAADQSRVKRSWRLQPSEMSRQPRHRSQRDKATVGDREEFVDDWEGLSGEPDRSPPPAVEAASRDRIDTIFPIPTRRRGGPGRRPARRPTRPQPVATPKNPSPAVPVPAVPSTRSPTVAKVSILPSALPAAVVAVLCGTVLVATRLVCQSSFPAHMWHAPTPTVMLAGALLALGVGTALHRRWQTKTVLFGLIGALIVGAAEVAAPLGVICAVVVQLATRGARDQPNGDRR